MFETQTADVILNRMLARVSDTLDKREGSIIYDTLAPVAEELAAAYINLDIMNDDSYADSATYNGLVRRGYERGIVPIEGSQAIVKIQVTPASVELDEDTEFNIETVNYTVTDDLGNGLYAITCNDTGSIGNAYAGQKVIPKEDVPGLQAVTIVGLIMAGRDEEDVEDFRRRYIDTFENQSFAGNVSWYKETIEALAGVGACKVIPSVSGDGNVIVYVVDGENQPLDSQAVQAIQNELDPDQNGRGNGIVPIGHTLSVRSAVVSNDTVRVTYKVDAAYASTSYTDVEDALRKIIEAYYEELRQRWRSSSTSTVKPGDMSGRLYQSEFVDSVSSLTVNGATANVVLGQEYIPTLGSLTFVRSGYNA